MCCNANAQADPNCSTFNFTQSHTRPANPDNKNPTFAVTQTILKKAVNIFLLTFYSFATFCLTLGDFSVLQDIPEMYRHCKATEDKDMTPLDFITDHLVNIDGLFDKHENGDEQKPHQPKQNEHQGQPTFFFLTHLSFAVRLFIPMPLNPSIPSDNFLPSDHISKIFRPPIA